MLKNALKEEKKEKDKTYQELKGAQSRIEQLQVQIQEKVSSVFEYLESFRKKNIWKFIKRKFI